MSHEDLESGSWLSFRASRIPRAAIALLGGLGLGTTLACYVLGLRWVPDCGGVAYGTPMPWLQTNMGSSMEFDWSVLALVGDGLILGAPAILLLWWALRALARRGRFQWVLLGFGSLLTWLGVVPLLLLTVVGYGPVLLLNGPVFEWREITPYIGPARWDDHLEAQCN